MPMKRSVSVGAARKLDDSIRIGGSMAAAGPLPPGVLLATARLSLRMTQAQLAKRAGMEQAQVARFERGRGDARLGTARRLFSALGLELLVSAAAPVPLARLLEERVRAVAHRRVARVAATMALERQEPDARALRALEKEEEARLRERGGSELWDD
ncbi:helix-turn-helix domain-containing protein [bacterium]|nr:MAG: helix-turn-helix domain-containing protein [bacterium]